jgi:hypothetical protein
MLLVALVVLATAQFQPGDLLGRKLNAVVPSERRVSPSDPDWNVDHGLVVPLTWQPSSGVRPGQPLPGGGGLLPYRRRVLPRLVCLGGGFQFGRLHLLDLDQLLLDGGGLRLDVLGSYDGLGAGGLGMDHELGQEEQADVVIGALLPDLERGLDGVQQPQQVEERRTRGRRA